MQLNAGGIYFMVFVIKKKIKKKKKNSHKQPVIFENTYQSKRNPRDIGGKSVFVDANILYLYVLMYKI